MKYFKWFNILCFVVLLIVYFTISDKAESPVEGFYKRTETIITQGEDRIELETHADFLASEHKYTSIINVTDVDKVNQFSAFSIDGDIHRQDNLIIVKTNKVEETNAVNKPVVFVASSSPIVSQIQKALLGVDIYKERRYTHMMINDYFCYYDVDKHVARCMK